MSTQWLYVVLIIAALVAIWRIVTAILRARKQSAHDDWDSQLVKNLRAAGGNAFTPYEVDFFFTVPDETACGSLRGALEPQGFSVDTHLAKGEATVGYSVHARKQLRVTVTEMQEYSQRFRQLAEQYDGYYDGWMTDPSRT
jgi:hypothetical protein